MRQVRFDDLPALEALVGDAFSDFGPRVAITQEMIDGFAELTGDDQWIHTDVARCERESPFGKPIAHGFLVLSLIGTLAPKDELVIAGQRTIINYGADLLRFVSPVPVESEIHARRRVAHVRRKGNGTQITFETEVHVVGAERPAMVYRALVLFMP